MNAFEESILSISQKAGFFVTDANQRQSYQSDWTEASTEMPEWVVRPETAEQVSQVLKVCSQFDVSIVASGGRTGLAGGACVTEPKQIVLSMERLNKIIEINETDELVYVEAGVILEELQSQVSEMGWQFGLDLAAKGSCQIGGNIATNAGGIRFVRYGGMRDQVLGLEVVLANGDILELGHGLRKNNVGPELMHQFIGSEGTLGVITKAYLKIRRPTPNPLVCLVGSSSIEKTMDVFCSLKKEFQLSAFEVIDPSATRIVLNDKPELKRLVSNENLVYSVIEVDAEHAEIMEQKLASFFEDESIEDGMLATTSHEYGEVWALRENISESLASRGRVRKNDVSVRVSKIPEFMNWLSSLRTDIDVEGFELVLFGHLGDGNIHINYSAEHGVSKEIFDALASKLEKKVYKELQRLSGSFSAEHGIGVLKRSAREQFLHTSELSAHKAIKNCLDPKGVLNPGKVFI